MYYGRLSVVMRYKLEISIFVNFAPLVDTTLLNSIFATRISTVGVANSPGWLTLSPPTVNRVRFFSTFSGRILHTDCPYVTSLILDLGT